MRTVLVIALPILVVSLSCKLRKDTFNLIGYQQDTVAKYQPDTTIVNWSIPFKDSISKQMSEVLCITDTIWAPGRPNSNLGALVSEVFVESIYSFVVAELKKDSNWMGLRSFGLMNVGGMRTALPLGEVTVGNVFEVFPFENELIVLKISGKQLDSMCKHIVFKRKGEALCGLFIKVRDQNIEILNSATDLKGNQYLEKTDLNKDYFLVTNDYLASGGDGFFMLKNAKIMAYLNVKVRDVVIQKLKTEKFLRRRFAQNIEIIKVNEE